MVAEKNALASSHCYFHHIAGVVSFKIHINPHKVFATHGPTSYCTTIRNTQYAFQNHLNQEIRWLDDSTLHDPTD